jgi:hypothetical protein
MVRHLPYFRQLAITCPLLALLLSSGLFTDSSRRDQLLSHPHFPVQHSPPSTVRLFSVCCLLFCKGGISLPSGLC